ncbi:MAG: histidine phosphatase family protein [Burkholderiaceae bacterium]
MTNAATLTDIILIRHGETDWNAERRLQGHLDVGLNRRGRRQAAAVAAALRDEPLDAIVSSDLQRARDTAEAIAAPHGLPVETVPALRERRFGAFEGLRYDEIRERYPDAYAIWQAREPDARPPTGQIEGETLREFHHRTTTALEALAARFAGRRIVVVAHGGVLDCIHRAATGLPLSRAREAAMPNAGINRLRHDGARLALVGWADVAHLAAPALDEL